MVKTSRLQAYTYAYSYINNGNNNNHDLLQILCFHGILGFKAELNPLNM